MTDSDKDLYLTVEQVADRLKLSLRQAARYADRVQTRKAGKRTMFRASDVEALAQQLNVEYRPPPMPRAELVPIGATLEHIRQQEQQLIVFAREVGRLEGIISEREHNQRVLTQDVDDLKARLAAVEAERDRLRVELDRLRDHT
jgi:hypothetical protein